MSDAPRGLGLTVIPAIFDAPVDEAAYTQAFAKMTLSDTLETAGVGQVGEGAKRRVMDASIKSRVHSDARALCALAFLAPALASVVPLAIWIPAVAAALAIALRRVAAGGGDRPGASVIRARCELTGQAEFRRLLRRRGSP